MHWLTWRQLWEFVRSWQGAAATSIAILAAIYYGPRQVLETWDWYWDRFRDIAVYGVVKRRKIMGSSGGQTNFGPAPQPIEIPYSAREIADYLNRKEKSVLRSLRRLEYRGKIECYQKGWRLKD